MPILLLAAALVPPAAPPPPQKGEVTTVQQAMDVLARKATPRAAFPLGNPGGWIRPSDYPSTAKMDQAEGAVSFSLKIDPQGRVSECTVTISSGVAVLDDTACNLITQRAVFDPARDKKGKAIWGSYSSRVVWMFNDPRPLPKPMEMVTSFIVEVDGSVSGCALTMPEIDEAKRTQALRACAAGHYDPYRDDAGKPVRRRFRATTKVEVEPVD